MHDFGGCHVDEVLSAIGLTVSDLFPPRDNEHRHQSRASRIPASDVLAAVAVEINVVYIVASDLGRRRAINDEDFARLGQAVSRLQAAVGVANGYR